MTSDIEARLKVVRQEIVNHIDAGAARDHIISLPQGKLEDWFDGLEAISGMLAVPQEAQDSAGECGECKKPAPSLNSNGMCEKCAEDLSEGMDSLANIAFILRRAETTFGFLPQTEAAKEFAVSLERCGWLYERRTAPVWVITPSGRRELARITSHLTQEEADEAMSPEGMTYR